MRRVAWAALFFLSSGVGSGCSLAYDFSTFHTAERDASTVDVGASDAGLDAESQDGSPGVDAWAVDVGPEVDAAGSDGGTTDAALPTDASGLDAARADVGPTDAGPTDAGHDGGRTDAGSPVTCAGFAPRVQIPLGPIPGLPTVIGNSSFRVVGTPGSDLAIVWVDTSGAAHIHAFHVDVSTETSSDLIPDTTFATGFSSGTRLAVADTGTDWITLAYPPRTLVRCATGGSCTTVASGASGIVGLSAGASGVALVHSASAAFTWRASGLTGASLDLTDQPSHGMGIDVVARRSGGYVALLNQQYLGGEYVAFAWFAQPPTASAATIATSAVTSPINSLYLTHDAATDTAIGVASELATMRVHLLTSHAGAVVAEVDAWAGTQPAPIVSRGDGTFYVHDATGYSLRTVAAPTTALARPGDPGDIGAPLVIGGAYAYLSIFDMTTDGMVLNVYPCL